MITDIGGIDDSNDGINPSGAVDGIKFDDSICACGRLGPKRRGCEAETTVIGPPKSKEFMLSVRSASLNPTDWNDPIKRGRKEATFCLKFVILCQRRIVLRSNEE